MPMKKVGNEWNDRDRDFCANFLSSRSRETHDQIRDRLIFFSRKQFTTIVRTLLNIDKT